ncbi:hypothetical protein B5U98_00070 [Bosea sp. Tri-39]|nr:hypothetical protein B5U98_00070 [Bosea sp. Tri-39]RXT36107.1 hypothetical protein B5U99_17930 [Bosea sp. Tri-54]
MPKPDAKTNTSLSVPPSKVSLPAPPTRISAPANPLKPSFPLPPVIRLSLALPVPLKLPEPV